jgi:hypothetical protein
MLRRNCFGVVGPTRARSCLSAQPPAREAQSHLAANHRVVALYQPAGGLVVAGANPADELRERILPGHCGVPSGPNVASHLTPCLLWSDSPSRSGSGKRPKDCVPSSLRLRYNLGKRPTDARSIESAASGGVRDRAREDSAVGVRKDLPRLPRPARAPRAPGGRSFPRQSGSFRGGGETPRVNEDRGGAPGRDRRRDNPSHAARSTN